MTKNVATLSFNSLTEGVTYELIQNLLEPRSGKLWLQKTVNLLKQIMNAEYVFLCAYSDNLYAIASNDPLSFNNKNFKESHDNNQRENEQESPYWQNDKYIIPLSFEGRLEIYWLKKPAENLLGEFHKLIALITNSFAIRASYVLAEKNYLFKQSLLHINDILAVKGPLKEKISLVASEIAKVFNASRVQVKIFSDLNRLNLNNALTFEYIKNGCLEAISVVPNIEQRWLENISLGELIVLSSVNLLSDNVINQNIESLLSIKSILGYPIQASEKAVGVIVLHQCDYDRFWTEEEISYIKQASGMLGVVISSEAPSIKDFDSKLIGVDDFLREVSHCQAESNLLKSPFSLLMIDIEKLRDINLKMGFVAGNLVLSQTLRYLNRLIGDKYKIARYSNDEFIVIMRGVDQNCARVEAEKIKDYLSNVSVLGIGTVDYNFSFVTYPTHTDSIAELLTILEQGMILSKSRGKLQISGFDEIHGQLKGRWQQLLTHALPEIIVKSSSLKTGPEVIETIKKQVSDLEQNKNTYSADILDSVQSLALALDAKDSYTEGHSKRVSEYAFMLAKSLGLDYQEMEWIRLAALMHDIGKIGIPESILCKPGKLTKEEYEVMKKHPVIGAKILKPIGPLEKVANLVLYHHEYWDGSGYPHGISKAEIPLGARIVCIVDAYQAMTSNRPYRSSLSFDEAVSRLKSGKEKQWDPDLVEMFIKLLV